MSYSDDLKQIATADSEDERLELAGRLGERLSGEQDLQPQLDSLTKERDELKSQLDAVTKERDDIRKSYVDRFFDYKKPDDRQAEQPSQPEAVTLQSFLGLE